MLQAVIAASECAQLFESVWKCVLKEIRLACSPGFGRNSPHRRSGSGVSTFVPLFQGGRRVFCGRGFFISSEHTPCSPLAKGDKPLAKGQSLKIGVFATSRRFDCAVSSDYGYLVVETRRFVACPTRNDDETSDCRAERAAPWSPAARGRFGWARRVAPKESGDTSPHSKISNFQPLAKGRNTVVRFRLKTDNEPAYSVLRDTSPTETAIIPSPNRTVTPTAVVSEQISGMGFATPRYSTCRRALIA